MLSQRRFWFCGEFVASFFEKSMTLSIEILLQSHEA